MKLAFYFYITAEIPVLMPMLKEASGRGHECTIIIHSGFENPELQEILETYVDVELKKWEIVPYKTIICPLIINESMEYSFNRYVPYNEYDFIIATEARRVYMYKAKGKVALVYHGIGWTKGEQIRTELSWEKDAYVSFVTANPQKRIMSKYCPNKRIEVVGFPKFDIPHKAEQNKEFTVLYAPTWDNAGSLEYIGQRVPELPYNIIIKLHRNTIEKRFKVVDWVDFYRIKGIEVNSGLDIVDDILKSHVVLTDFSSVALEALVLNRPVIAFDNGNVTEQKEKLWWQVKDLMYIVKSFDEIKGLLAVKNLPLKPQHQERVKEICEYPDGASKRILNCLEEYAKNS